MVPKALSHLILGCVQNCVQWRNHLILGMAGLWEDEALGCLRWLLRR